MAARVWVLNLDADHELAVGDGYTPSRAIRQRLPELRRGIQNLVAPCDIVLDGSGVVDVAGLEGHAFCMTTTARGRLEAAGAVAVAAPSVDVIRRVNHRRFCAELGQTLPGATFVTTVKEVERAVVSIDSPLGALLKRPLGFAGRGQRRVRTTLTDADRSWLAATPIEDGVQVEPRLCLIVEHAVHGHLGEDGSLSLGPVVIQLCGAFGAWRDTRRATTADLDSEEITLALAEARRVAEALCRAHYFGPFGVDGFIYEGRDGSRRHQPRSEINARYTMGWSLA